MMLLDWASDDVCTSNAMRCYENTRNAGKEGGDTRRKAGQAGMIADEWIRWASECKRRGLDWRVR